MKKVLTYLAIVLIAAANALNYELFVFPNSFAPSGLNGLCTMFQYLTGVSMGYLSLLLNLPLAIAVYCKVSKSNRSAVRFEIITEHPERLRQTITEQLHHSATVVPGRGIYAGRQTNVIICVVNRTQEHALAELIRRTPGTFAIVDQVSDVVGRFVRISGSGKEEQPIFDDGDGTGIE
ncbi:MAG: YitT family protein [Firmicutes bacterium]|nr:YitT family protein [Bacillota bacterium]